MYEMCITVVLLRKLEKKFLTYLLILGIVYWSFLLCTVQGNGYDDDDGSSDGGMEHTVNIYTHMGHSSKAHFKQPYTIVADGSKRYVVNVAFIMRHKVQ